MSGEGNAVLVILAIILVCLFLSARLNGWSACLLDVPVAVVMVSRLGVAAHLRTLQERNSMGEEGKVLIGIVGIVIFLILIMSPSKC